MLFTILYTLVFSTGSGQIETVVHTFKSAGGENCSDFGFEGPFFGQVIFESVCLFVQLILFSKLE